ncbi:MAG: hypothetical protein WD379_02055 [Dehalococcoidia bacterium]
MKIRPWALLIVAAAAAALLVACEESSGDESNGDGTGGNKTYVYDVRVSFSEEVTQEDMDSVGDFLRGFDPDVDFLIQEIFPPIGVAEVTTDDTGFCDALESELEGKGYVREVTCGPHVEADDSGDPDEPVRSDDDEEDEDDDGGGGFSY